MRIEDLPKPLLCAPLVVHWFWLSARHGSTTLPSVVNPTIAAGGLVGESKAACLEQIGKVYASHVAPWCRVGPGDDPRKIHRALGCSFPMIAKPDVGWCGFGVRRINDENALLAYATHFPKQTTFILQRFVEAPLEAGLFYVREPQARTGRLVSVTLRHSPAVIGDGVSDIGALIGQDRRLRRHMRDYEAALGKEGLRFILGPGEEKVITTVASLRVGSRYEDISWSITEALHSKVDAIACSMDRFHWGRFDVRFNSMTELRAGVFQIIEVNGAGSEAINFWDPQLPLLAAFRGIFAKQVQLFRLGSELRRHGYKPISVIELAKAWLYQRRLIAAYPRSN